MKITIVCLILFSTFALCHGGAVQNFADWAWSCSDAACVEPRVSSGNPQPNYQCAEFVARSLVAGGYIPNLHQTGSQSSYHQYKYGGKIYNLLWTSSRGNGILGLEDLLKTMGWRVCGTSTSCVTEGAVVFTHNYGHVTIGVSNNLIDAHNYAYYHVSLAWFGTANAIYVAP